MEGTRIAPVTPNERKFLIQLINEHVDVINLTEKGVKAVQEKQEAWKNIGVTFTAAAL